MVPRPRISIAFVLSDHKTAHFSPYFQNPTIPMLPSALVEPLVELGIIRSQGGENRVIRIDLVCLSLHHVGQVHRFCCERLHQPFQRLLHGQDARARASPFGSSVKANVLGHQEINSLGVERNQKANIRPVIVAIDCAKASEQRLIVRNGYAAKPLKLRQLAQGNGATRAVFVALNVVVIGPIDEKSNTVFATEANQLSEGRLNGLGVFEPDQDVCVHEKFEIVHHSAT